MSKVGRYAAQRRKVEAITKAKTVEVSDCGTMFTIDADSSAYDITLPRIQDAGKGWWCSFTIIDVHASQDIDIVAASGDEDKIFGAVMAVSSSHVTGAETADRDEALASGTSIAAADKVIFDASDTQTIGDFLEIWTDGNNWYCHGMAGAVGSSIEGSG